MSMLYRGNYYRRYHAICKLITGKKVTELCFGDTIIARYCKKHHIGWTGYDINPNFIKNAAGKGYDVVPGNIKATRSFASADVCIISGSLYHFHEDVAVLFEKMLTAAPLIILSEPVINLSDRNGIIGKLAKASANVNGKEQHFRYTETTLLQTLNELSLQFNFTFSIAGRVEKDIIILIKK